MWSFISLFVCFFTVLLNSKVAAQNEDEEVIYYDVCSNDIVEFWKKISKDNPGNEISFENSNSTLPNLSINQKLKQFSLNKNSSLSETTVTDKLNGTDIATDLPEFSSILASTRLPYAAALGAVQYPSFTKPPKVIQIMYNLNLTTNMKIGSQVIISPCVFKTNFPNNSFETYWLKDGTKRIKADIRQLQDNIYEFISDNFLKNPLVLGDEGFYQCFILISGEASVLSEKFDIQFQDTVSFKITLMQLSSTNSLVQFVNAQKRSKRNVPNLLNIMDNTAVTGYFNNKIQEILESIFHFNINSKILEISEAIIMRVTFIEVENSAKLTLYQAFQNLQNLVSSQNMAELNAVSLNTKSLDYCHQDIYGDISFKGVYDFPDSLYSTLVQINCSYGTGFATRYCLGNFQDGPIWDTPNLENCNAKSLTTQQLIEISKYAVCTSDDNVIGCLSVIQLVSNVHNIVSNSSFEVTTHFDIDFLAYILSKVVTNNNLQGAIAIEVAKKVLSIVSVIMNCNETIISQSEVSNSSITLILSLLDLQARSLSQLLNIPIGAISIPENNIALYVNFINENGFSLYARQNGNKSLEILDNQNNILASDLVASIYIPSEAVMPHNDFSSNKVYSYIFRKDVLFKKKKNSNSSSLSPFVQSFILSATILDSEVANLTDPVVLKFHKYYESNITGSDSCAFWNINQGTWSTKGCTKVSSENNVVTCSCNHLTNFALLLDVSQDAYNPVGLEYVTWIGCGISIVSLVITLVTFSIFRNLRKKLAPKILMFLCVSLMGLLVTFLTGAQATYSRLACRVSASLIQLFTLMTFSWMGIEAVNLYRSLVIVFKKGGNTSFLKKSCLFAIGFPVVTVVITAAVKPDNLGNEKVCLVQGLSFTLGVLVPVVITLFFNFFVLALVLRALAIKKMGEKREYYLKQIKLTFICAVLLGLTWVFGVLSIKSLKKPMQWLFCITTSLQGFFIFVFYVVQNKEAVKEWSRVIGLRVSSSSSTASTSNNNFDSSIKKKASCVSIPFEKLS
ncbi:adhesion G-protein coupled receptor G4 isoform X1 [Hydra vulgaris]|uniref:adhesion G-protein coupled receptor G4 isoform X1 n=1 Tax=Hydra vulgaris TaxID=6087 RepID=UPI001F5E5CED|nr:adhesion G-protein coupled receptor G4 isoform X1 [Hydra vulgaris]